MRTLVDELSAAAREICRKARNLSPGAPTANPAPDSDVLANPSSPVIWHYFARTSSRSFISFISFHISQLQPLASLFAHPVLCFQCVAASFAKNRGVDTLSSDIKAGSSWALAPEEKSERSRNIDTQTGAA
jgi:hypothetical protein